MPKIYPFKGVHFDTSKAKDLTPLTTQPYDKINPALQDEYYKKHEYNLIRVILRKDEPGKDVRSLALDVSKCTPLNG